MIISIYRFLPNSTKLSAENQLATTIPDFKRLQLLPFPVAEGFFHLTRVLPSAIFLRAGGNIIGII
jgi:hypothetical protein